MSKNKAIGKQPSLEPWRLSWKQLGSAALNLKFISLLEYWGFFWYNNDENAQTHIHKSHNHPRRRLKPMFLFENEMLLRLPAGHTED